MVEIVSVWRVDSKERQCALEGFLGGLLRVEAADTRTDHVRSRRVEILLRVAKPILYELASLRVAHRSLGHREVPIAVLC